MADQIVQKRYHLEYRLGQGGFSEVWKAWDSHAHRTVAIKLFLQQDEEGIALCREEFTKTNQLQHPNIIRLLEFGVDNKIPFLVMPYYQGGAALAHAGKISENELWFLIRDIAAALDHVHGQQPPMLHNDLKPDNFLIDQERECFILTDFGISYSLAEKFLRELAQGGKKPAGQSPMAYRAPERFTYKDHVEETPIKASDIWAFGACLYELATGELPFGEQGGLYQLMQFTDYQRPVSELVDPLPDRFSADLRELIFQALDFKPWRRPLAKDFVQAAQRHLGLTSAGSAGKYQPSRLPQPDTPDPVRESSAKAVSSGKRLWIWVGTGGLVAATLLGIFICNPQAFRQTTPPSTLVEQIPTDTPALTFDSQPPIKTVKNQPENKTTTSNQTVVKNTNTTPIEQPKPKPEPKAPVKYYLTVQYCSRKVEADSIRDALQMQFSSQRVWVGTDAWGERFQINIGYFSKRSEASDFGVTNRSSITAFTIQEQ